jgi:hypothetical protein
VGPSAGTLPTDTLAQKRDSALILVSARARISEILRLNRTTGNQTACGQWAMA